MVINIKLMFLLVASFPNVDRQPYAYALIKSPSFHRRLLREIDGSRSRAMLLREEGTDGENLIPRAYGC